MGTKQVKMEFQVVADDKVSAQVTITMGGVQKFSGSLAHTVDVMPSQVFDDQTPYSLVEFDLDVADMPTPLTSCNSHGMWVTPVDLNISVTDGSITLQALEANYVATPTPPPYTSSPSCIPGNAETFAQMWYANEPVWTPPAVGRLDNTDNVDTGPGSLLLLENESVATQIAMAYYSAA